MKPEHKAYKERQLDKAIEREAFNDKVFAKKVKDFQRREDIESIRNTGNIFVIIFAILLVMMIMRYFINSSAPIPSFASLLEYLENVSAIQIPIISTEKIDIPFFEFFANLINVVIFFANGIFSVITFLTTFIVWAFGM